MRKLKYLAAGVASLFLPLFLGTVAVGIGLSDSGGFASSYLRFLIFPHIVPAVCLFFLYLDEDKYRSFKPLVAFLALGSMVFLAASLIPAAGNLPKLMLATKDAQGFMKSAVAFFASLLIDIFCGFTVIPGSLVRHDRKSVAAPESGDTTLPNKEQ
ncbi:MAG TPA: hypothetical protein VN445_08860 [Rectinemataceae bacterium]|nr:hypothetical protein [Rectinemataceae bacterium]